MSSVFENTIFCEIFESKKYNLFQLLSDNIPDNTIANKLKKLRVSNNVTQLQFARSIKRGFGTVTKWEQGINTPSKSTLNEIIDVYNLPENYFD